MAKNLAAIHKAAAQAIATEFRQSDAMEVIAGLVAARIAASGNAAVHAAISDVIVRFFEAAKIDDDDRLPLYEVGEQAFKAIAGGVNAITWSKRRAA